MIADTQAAMKGRDIIFALRRVRSLIEKSGYNEEVDRDRLNAAQKRILAQFPDAEGARNAAAHPEIRQGTAKNHASGPFNVPGFEFGEGSVVSISQLTSEQGVITTKGSEKSGDFEARVITTPVSLDAAYEIHSAIEEIVASLPPLTM